MESTPRDHERPPTHQGFESTRWSVIYSARDGEGKAARDAFAQLCEAYWYPLYALARRKGCDSETAEDVVQGFVARLLEKQELVAVDRGKGKFRSFLMAAFTHYLANQREHDRAKKRGGGKSPVSIDRLAAEGRYGLEPAHDMTPERLFEKKWALTLMERVIGQLESEMTSAGKRRQFDALKPAIFGGTRETPFVEIAATLGVSEDAARAAAHRVRRRFRALLQAEVMRTVDDPGDIAGEIAELFLALRS